MKSLKELGIDKYETFVNGGQGRDLSYLISIDERSEKFKKQDNEKYLIEVIKAVTSDILKEYHHQNEEYALSMVHVGLSRNSEKVSGGLQSLLDKSIEKMEHRADKFKRPGSLVGSATLYGFLMGTAAGSLLSFPQSMSSANFVMSYLTLDSLVGLAFGSAAGLASGYGVGKFVNSYKKRREKELKEKILAYKIIKDAMRK